MNTPETNYFDTVVVSDTYFGTEIGTLFKDRIRNDIEEQQKHHPDSYRIAEYIAPYEEPSMQYVPDIYDQLYQMSQAAGVPLDRMFLTYLPEHDEAKFWSHGSAVPSRCTTIVSFDSHGKVLAGHNEDWDLGMYPKDTVAMVKTPTVFGLWYMGEGLGSAAAVNKHGVWLFANQVDVQPQDHGVPRLLTAWSLALHTRSVEEAIRFIQQTPQASAFTYEVVQNGTVARIEHARGITRYTASHQSIATTNHLISEDLKRFERDDHMQSSARLERAISKAHPGMTIDEMRILLGEPPISREETLAAIIATENSDGTKTMHICYGRPSPDSIYVPYTVEFTSE